MTFEDLLRVPGTEEPGVVVETASPPSLVADLPLRFNGVHLSIPKADATNDGYLSSADWNLFHGGSAFTGLFTDLNFIGSNLNEILTRNFSDLQSIPTTLAGYGITDAVPNSRTVSTIAPISGGGALSGNLALAMHVADASHDGYLSQGDWGIFNSKQAAVSFIDSITLSGSNVLLSGDAASPGNSKYYGTDVGGIKGFFALPTVSGSALTKTDDTNVTLTLGGSPTTALVNASSLTLGWTGNLAVARGGTGSGTASGARTNLGSTTVGDNIFTVTNPSAIRFLKVNADNSVTLEDAATFRSDIGAGSGGGSVTSVGLSTDRSWLTVGSSPITTNGTITLNGTAGLTANQVIATPDGTTGTVSLRALVAADIPSLAESKITNLVSDLALKAPLASPALTGVPTSPTASQNNNSTQIATTAYTDLAVSNAIAGVNPAVAVQAATTAAGDTSGLTYSNGVGGIGATLTGANNTALTVDGYTFTALGQRLLVKNDTQSPSGAFNGIYYVTQIQAALLPLILTRALDYDMPSDMNNTGAIPVINGTSNGTTSWVLTSSVTTVGTDPLTFTEFSLKPSTIVTTSRTLTIGGTAQDLSADRSWLSNVTNDTQTKSAIVPNTAPSAGQLLTGNAGGTAYAPVSLSGSGATATLSSSGVLTLSAIANATLTNSAITIAGTSTSLGGSITQDTITGLGSTGLIKRTGANALGIATAKSDYWDTTDFSGPTTHGLVPDPGAAVPAVVRFLGDDATWHTAGSSGSGLLVAPITVNDYGTSFTIADTGGLNQPTRSTLASTERMTFSGTSRETIFDPSNIPYQKGAYNQPSMIIRSSEFVQQYSRLIDSGNERSTFTEDGRLILFDQLGVAAGNPTSSIGLTAVNGSAATFLRSDSAQALDQSIAPTWTGLHAWKRSDSGTLNPLAILTVGYNSTGTPGQGFGPGIQFQAKDDTTTDQEIGDLNFIWTTVAHATHESALAIKLQRGGSIVEVARFTGQSGLTVGNGGVTSVPAGVISADTGFRISNLASSGTLLQGNGTNYIASTMSWPSGAAPTSRKIVVSNGTNMVASTETWATPGAAGQSLTSDGTNWISGTPPQVTLNDYGVGFTIPDTGSEIQPTRSTLSGTERGTFAGTGRQTVSDPSASLLTVDKSFISPPSFILRDGEFVFQYGRTALTGNKRATMTETGRLIGTDFTPGSRLILTGSSQNNN